MTPTRRPANGDRARPEHRDNDTTTLESILLRGRAAIRERYQERPQPPPAPQMTERISRIRRRWMRLMSG